MKYLSILAVMVAFGVVGFLIIRANTVDIESAVEQTQAELAVEKPVDDTDTTQTEALARGPSVIPIEHASMVLTWGERTIYVDPVGDPAAYADLLAPDIVLLTDIHGDHLSTSTLEGILAPNARIIAPSAVVARLPEVLRGQVVELNNGEATTLDALTITAVPMYNVPESADAFHTRGRGNGYLLELEDFRVYIAGDTGPTPEMRALEGIDMAFVPMNLPYTMSVAAAAEAVVDFAPATVIPYHYRGPDGLADVAEFKRLVEASNAPTEVLLLNWYPAPEPEAAAAETEAE